MMTPRLPATNAAQVSSTFLWTPGLGQSGTHQIQFSVRNERGLQSACATTVIVTTNENPPACSITPPGPITVLVGTTLTCVIAGSDPDPNSTITLAGSAFPAGAATAPSLPLTGTSPVQTTFTWTPSLTQTGTHVLRFTVADQTEAEAACFLTLRVVEFRDDDPPFCSFYVTSGPPDRIVATVRDPGGLASIDVELALNCDVVVPPFLPGTTNEVVVIATQRNTNQAFRLEIVATDLAGNQTQCDPIITTLRIDSARPAMESFTTVPRRDRYVIARNGRPGAATLALRVNGLNFEFPPLADGDTHTLDIGSALRDGNNTVEASASGPVGGSVQIIIADGLPGSSPP